MRFSLIILLISFQFVFSQIPDSIRAVRILEKIQQASVQTPVDSIKTWYNDAAFTFALGKNWKNASATLRKGAEYLLKINRVQEAKNWLNQAEDWDAEYQGTKNLAWSNVMEYGAYLNQKNKDEKTAFTLWKDCLEIRKKLLYISDPLLYKTYYELGLCAEKNGEWETARECLVTCQALTNKPEDKIRFALKTAEICMNLMDYRQALYAYLPLIKTQKDSILYALFIAECYLELNIADSAGVWLDLWHASIKSKQDKPEMQGFLLEARKAILEKNTRTALNWIREARTQVDTSQKVSADLDIAEGEVWEALSLLDNAEKSYLSAYQWHISHPNGDFARAYSAWKLGQVYIRKRLFDKALTFLYAAEGPFIETLGSRSIQSNEIRYQIAEILYKQNNYQHALAYTDFILKEKNYDPVFHELRKKAIVLETEIKLKLYEQFHDVNLLKNSVKTYMLALDECIQDPKLNMSDFRLLLEKTIGLHLELFARTMDSTWLYQAWNLTDQNRMVLANLANKNINKLAANPSETDWLVEQQQITYKNLWKRALSGKLSVWELKKLHEKLDSLQLRLEESVKHDSIMTCDWTCKPWQINPDKHVISYFIGRENQYVFYSNTKKIIFKNIGNQQNKDERVSNFRKAILFRDFPSFVSLSYKLYEEWLQFMIQSEIKSIKKLIICPDSYLFYLPFEALSTQMMTPETPYHNIPYLINKMEIAYQMTYPKSKDATITQNIIFFQPTMVDSLKKRALQEGFTIVQPDLSQETDTISKDATAKWVKPGTTKQFSQIQANNLVQWNLPMFIREDFPEQSAAFFANGLFRFEQIPDFQSAGLSLGGIDWSLSYQNRGIGMLFLLKNIQNKCTYANIPLWKMETSVKLRLQFYKNIKSNNHSTALRMAKLAILKEKNTVPFDWAGLLLYEMP